MINESQLVKEYSDGKSLVQCQRDYGLNMREVKKILNQNRIHIRNRNEQNVYSNAARVNGSVNAKYFDELYDFLRNYSRDILGNVFNTRFINYSQLVDLIERYFALQTIDYTMISDYEVLKRNMSQEVYYGYKNFVENNQHLTDIQIQTLFGMFKTYQ